MRVGCGRRYQHGKHGKQDAPEEETRICIHD
jgi:hypothetical protein